MDSEAVQARIVAEACRAANVEADPVLRRWPSPAELAAGHPGRRLAGGPTRGPAGRDLVFSCLWANRMSEGQDGGGQIGILELFQFMLARLKNVQRETEAKLVSRLENSGAGAELNKDSMLLLVRKIFAALDVDNSGDIDRVFEAMNPFKTMMRVRPLDPDLNSREQERKNTGFYNTNKDETRLLKEEEDQARLTRHRVAFKERKKEIEQQRKAKEDKLLEAQKAARKKAAHHDSNSESSD